MEHLNTTTRKYPRTLEEAFPRDYGNAYAISKHRPQADVDWIVGLFVIFAAGFIVGLLVGELAR